MGISKSATRAATGGAIATALLAAAAVALVVGAGSPGARANAGARPLPAPAAVGWRQITTATSEGTLFYPPGWKQVPGDNGTVSRSLRDAAGRYVGYLNATPRQGAEQLHGWAAFRTGHNREEGDKQVVQVAAAEGLRFRNARGSCVIDDYVSKVGSNPYREIACLVAGHRHTDVLIAAALKRDWSTLGGTLERAVSAFVQG
jgi:hypothetical protein